LRPATTLAARPASFTGGLVRVRTGLRRSHRWWLCRQDQADGGAPNPTPRMPTSLQRCHVKRLASLGEVGILGRKRGFAGSQRAPLFGGYPVVTTHDQL